LGDPAAIEHDDSISDLQGLLLIVGDEQRRHLNFLMQATQPTSQFLAHFRVECAKRLVE
jgi:hypothetical protein